MGINKCLERVKEIMFWQGLTRDIENLVNDCPECAGHHNKKHKETLRQTKTSERPWSELGADLFEFEGQLYLLLIDYYSKFIEVEELKELTSKANIDALKSQFCRHGIPDTFRTDNGPQFSAREFSSFCYSLGIEHKTSSPAFPQSKGAAERGVQTVKKLWKKTKDKQIVLLDYRTTPLESCGMSPALLLMIRRPRNKLPTAKELLQPTAVNHS